MRDVVLTRDEVDGLMAGLLTSEEQPTGTTRLSDWLKDGADGLGRRYVSELTRNWLPGDPPREVELVAGETRKGCRSS